MIEVPVLPALLIELHQRRNVLGRGGTPKRAARERGDDSFSTGPFVARAGRAAHKDPAAAGRVVGALRIVRSINPDFAHVGEERKARETARLEGGSQEVSVQVVARRVIRGQESDADIVQPCFQRDARVRAAMHRRATPKLFVPIEQVHPLAVHEDFELFARDLTEGPVVVHVAQVHREDLEDVLAIGGELVSDEETAAGPERQTLDVVVLRRVLRHAIHRLGLGGHIADGQAADFSRSRQVGLKQRRRHHERARHVVETVGRIIGRQELRGIDFEREEIPNHVRVLGPVETVEAGRRQMGDRVPVELLLQPGDERLEGRRVRPPRTRGRHHAGPKFSHDLFPHFGLFANVREVETVKGEFARGLQARSLRPLVVAGDAVPIEDRALGGGGRRRGGECGRGLTAGGLLLGPGRLRVGRPQARNSGGATDDKQSGLHRAYSPQH